MQADGLVTIKHDNLRSYFKHMAKPHKYSQRSIVLLLEVESYASIRYKPLTVITQQRSIDRCPLH